MKTAVIFGATSVIAQAVAEQLARRGVDLFLVARSHDRLAIIAAHLHTLTGRECAFATDRGGASQILAQAQAKLGGIDFLLIAQGLLPEQSAAEQDSAIVEETMRANLLEPVAILHAAAPFMQARGTGTIAVISSVAADRGRQSNYVYGSAKAALDAVLSGLRNRLAPAGIHVVTVKPGFVDTPMTAALRKTPMFASPAAIAAGILQAVEAKRDIAYLPARWRWIMLIIRCIPERIFKKLRL